MNHPPFKEKTRIFITFHDVPEVSDRFVPSYLSAQNSYATLMEWLAPDDYLVMNPDWSLETGKWRDLGSHQFQVRLARFQKADFVLSFSSQKPRMIFLRKNDLEFDTLLVKDEFLEKADDLSGVLELFPKKKRQNLPPLPFQPGDVGRFWALGNLAYFSGDHQQAEKYYLLSLKADSTFLPALLGLARIELDSSRYLKTMGGYFQDHLAAANRYLTAARMVSDSVSQLPLLWGNYYLLFENFVMAEKELAKALRLNPNETQVYFLLSRLHPSRYSELGFQSEEALYRYALILNPASAQIRLWYGDYLIRQNRKEEAELVYREFLDELGPQMDLEIALIRLYISNRAYEQALERLDQARRVLASRSTLWDFQEGIVRFFAGDTTSALSLLEKNEVLEGFPDALLYLGTIAEKRGDLQKAIFYFRQRIRRNRGLNDPFKEEARKKLVQLLQKTGEIQ